MSDNLTKLNIGSEYTGHMFIKSFDLALYAFK